MWPCPVELFTCTQAVWAGTYRREPLSHPPFIPLLLCPALFPFHLSLMWFWQPLMESPSAGYSNQEENICHEGPGQQSLLLSNPSPPPGNWHKMASLIGWDGFAWNSCYVRKGKGAQERERRCVLCCCLAVFLVLFVFPKEMF